MRMCQLGDKMCKEKTQFEYIYFVMKVIKYTLSKRRKMDNLHRYNVVKDLDVITRADAQTHCE